MRAKFLCIIACFVFACIAISSCLNSDNNYVYSSDATVHAFSLDTIRGKNYTFDIDQVQRLIFNRDSLPVGSDTIIDSIMIDTFSVTGYVTSGTPDTILNISNAQNLIPASTSGITFKVYAADGLTSREYTLRINIHQEDPDSMVWNRMDGVPQVGGNPAGRKAIAWDDHLLLYTTPKEVYHTSAIPGSYNWDMSTTTLPHDALIESITTCGDTLAACTAGGDIYTSTNGIQWERSEALSGDIIALLAYLPTNTLNEMPRTLSAIMRNDTDGKSYFCRTNLNMPQQGWEMGEEVPENFPTQQLSSALWTTSTGLNQVFVVGTLSTENEHTTPWASMDGLLWADLYTEDAYCPSLTPPYIMNYNEALYLMGGTLREAYASSTGGIAWEETDEKFWFPEEFASKGTSYTLVTDPNNYIWIIWAGGEINEVWRGCLNKLKQF